MIPDRSTWTADGPIDLVAVERFTAGGDVPLSVAEATVAVHMMHAAGVGPAAIATRLHRNARDIRAILARPAPVDRLGRTFHTEKGVHHVR